MAKEIITSRENPKIKEIIKLKQVQKEREKQGLAVVEGYREISLALASKRNIVSLFFCPKFLKGKELFNLLPDKIIEVAPAVFEKISMRQNPDGVLALVSLPDTSLDKIKLSKNPLIIVLESVEKPGNLGAILRTADSAGVDAVIISDKRTDIFNPNVIRASQGTLFTTQIACGEMKEVYEYLKKQSISIYATTPAAKILYTDVNWKKGAAIIMGTEDQGLSEAWLKASDGKIKIPMRGKIDSLNVSAAAAIVVYEALRQRAGS